MNKAAWIALRTLAQKEVVRFLRIWSQTLLPPIVTTTLYFVIFGGLIGSRVGTMDGIAYMDFIVPGLVLMSVITSSYANVASSFFSAKFQRSIEELLVAPVPNIVILFGFMAGGVARGVLVGLVVLAVSFLFSDIQFHHPVLVFSVMVLTASLFSLAGLVNGMFANKFDDISIVPTFVLTPLTYLGGVFYSISLLPDFWQTVSYLNPIVYMINAFRYGFLGVSDLPIWSSFLIIFMFISSLFALCLWVLAKGYRLRH